MFWAALTGSSVKDLHNIRIFMYNLDVGDVSCGISTLELLQDMRIMSPARAHANWGDNP